MYDNRELEFGNELEFGDEFGQEYGQEFGQEYGQEHSNGLGQEFNEEFLNEFEYDNEYQGEYEYEGELSESLELELANELLSVSNEQELNYFFGKIGRAVGKFAKSSAGKMIGGALKSVARKALPWAAGALGGAIGGPLGAVAGRQLGSMASRLFELELEGLSPEDREFEVARAYVRFANETMRRGASIARRNPNAQPKQIVKAALKQAATQYAPGLLAKNSGTGRGRSSYGMMGTGSRQNGMSTSGRSNSGNWVRKGRTLILYNA